MKFKLSLIVVVFLAFATLGATRTVYAKDACSLLTPAQVRAVLGISVKPGHTLSDEMTVCDWPVVNFMTAPKGTKGIEVTILSSQDWAFAARTHAAPLKGIGDYAFYFGGTPFVTLYVKKGYSKFSVFVNGFPIDQAKAKEKALALDILAKL